MCQRRGKGQEMAEQKPRTPAPRTAQPDPQGVWTLCFLLFDALYRLKV